MPKGWMMDGKKPWKAAEIEALEEAGAKGYIASEKIGEYQYTKKLDTGLAKPCHVTVYPMIVAKLNRKWKERGERTRRWFTPKAAARRVDEPELAALLLQLSKKPHKLPAIKRLMKSV